MADEYKNEQTNKLVDRQFTYLKLSQPRVSR